MNDTHVNESILSEEILEDQKKNRIDHMTYLPGMEDIGSEIMDQVIEAMVRRKSDLPILYHRLYNRLMLLVCRL